MPSLPPPPHAARRPGLYAAAGAVAALGAVPAAAARRRHRPARRPRVAWPRPATDPERRDSGVPQCPPQRGRVGMCSGGKKGAPWGRGVTVWVAHRQATRRPNGSHALLPDFLRRWVATGNVRNAARLCPNPPEKLIAVLPPKKNSRPLAHRQHCIKKNDEMKTMKPLNFEADENKI